MSVLTYTDESFWLNGKPWRVLSGAIHYFRIHPDYWEDSLKKLKACGLNTVETYTCWNLHEPREGEFDFSGGLDVARFVDLAASLGLYVILRPGPFICAEWDFGGLPSWMLQYPRMNYRCNDPLFLEKIHRYYQKLFDILRPRLAENGGPIYMVQIENEYGSYSHDKDYMQAIINMYREFGVDSLLFTADGDDYNMLTGGMVDGYLATINFGGNVKHCFNRVRERGRTHPLMVGEYWCGQFDHWYEPRNLVSTEEAAETLDEILTEGGSVNLYMFQGGTNFAFTAGANHRGTYQPDVTSYDYNALLSEEGDRTDKYWAMKAVLEKHFGPAPDVDVEDTPKYAYGEVQLTQMAYLMEQLDAVSEPTCHVTPLCMEDLGQNFGFILYSTVMEGPLDKSYVRVHGLQDRALFFVNGEFAGIKERDHRDDDIIIEVGFGESCRLDILVENMGRINFGPMMPYERKGITHHVELVEYRYKNAMQTRLNWTMRPLPLTDLSKLTWQAAKPCKDPAFYRGTFRVNDVGNTFVKLPAFTKGVVFVNGFNLGRYWNPVGPQQTLYLPGAVLKQGENEIIVFELEGTTDTKAELLDTPELDTLKTRWDFEKKCGEKVE